MVVPLAADLPPDHLAAIRADERIFDHLAGGCAPHRLLRPQSERIPMAARTTLPAIIAPHGGSQRHGDASQHDHEDRPCGHRSARGRIRAAQIEFGAFEPPGQSLDACRHAGAVIPFAEVGKHVFHLDAFHDGVGQHALRAVARNDPDLASVAHQQDAHAVVAVAAPDAPRPEKFDGEAEHVAALDVAHSDHGHLSDVALAQRSAHGVDARHGRRRQDAVGIGDIARAVGTLDIGYVAHAVGFGCGARGDAERQQKRYQSFHSFEIRGGSARSRRTPQGTPTISVPRS